MHSTLVQLAGQKLLFLHFVIFFPSPSDTVGSTNPSRIVWILRIYFINECWTWLLGDESPHEPNMAQPPTRRSPHTRETKAPAEHGPRESAGTCPATTKRNMLPGQFGVVAKHFFWESSYIFSPKEAKACISPLVVTNPQRKTCCCQTNSPKSATHC